MSTLGDLDRSRSSPRPGAAPTAQMLRAQTAMELRLLLRNGEQVALTLVVPLLLEFFFNLPLLYTVGPRRIDFVVPSILALSVMSAAFTGLAIGTGFERKYGVLKRLGTTALPRSVLLAARRSASWASRSSRPCSSARSASRSAGTRTATRRSSCCCSSSARSPSAGSGLLVAGTLRAEVTLAGANLAWLILLFCGGIAIPLSKFPHGVPTCCSTCPRPRCRTACTGCCRTAPRCRWRPS